MQLGILRRSQTVLRAATVSLLILPGAAFAQTASPAPSVPPAMAPLLAFSSFAPVLDHVIPAVVTLLVTGETLVPSEMPGRDSAGRPSKFPSPMRSPFRSGGSGVLLDAGRGLILTNNHVVADGTSIEVSLSDGRRYKGVVVGRDPGTDVAVVRIDAPRLQEISVGNSDNARVGDVVLAIGNPYGLQGTATLGIISATMRANIGHEAFEDFMQIDAAINPGNSGGALVNVRGELIGINTVGPGEAGKAVGIGFAIPINMARTIMNEIVANGSMRRGGSGLVVEDLSREAIERVAMRITRGAQVTAVHPGSPAARAGIPVGAIVKALGSKPVRGAQEWQTRIATTPIGTGVNVAFEVQGVDRTAVLTIAPFMAPRKSVTLVDTYGGLAGIAGADIEAGHPLYGAIRGVEVLDVPSASPSFATGLLKGDVITSIDNAPVYGLEDLARRVSMAGKEYRVTFLRDNVPAWIRIVR
jgi:serine protease DegQ